MSEPDDLLFTLSVREGVEGKTIVEVWTRDGMTGDDMAECLRAIAQGFALGDDIKRIR